MGEMSVLNKVAGDVKTVWDPNNRDEVAAAKRQFDDLRAKGFFAYKVTEEGGKKGESITRFDPAAGRIILAPPMVGG